MERRDDNSASATVEQRISSADLRNRALAAAAADDEDITAISPLYSASSDLISDFQVRVVQSELSSQQTLYLTCYLLDFATSNPLANDNL